MSGALISESTGTGTITGGTETITGGTGMREEGIVITMKTTRVGMREEEIIITMMREKISVTVATLAVKTTPANDVELVPIFTLPAKDLFQLAVKTSLIV